jgi:gas vesicle protein
MTNKNNLEIAIESLTRQLGDYIKSSNKKFDQLAKVLNLVYEQGDMVEDVAIRMGEATDQVKYLKDNVQKFTKDIKSDMQEIKDTVEITHDKIEESTKKGE